jgi:hypothetical protein
MSDDKIPYGASPPEPKEEVMDKAEDVQEKEVAVEKPKMDYEKSYKELHSKFGETSNVVGELRKQNESLAAKMAEIEKQAAEREKAALKAEPPTDYEQMLADIADKYDSGEITFKQSQIETNRITREMTKAEAAAEKEAILEAARSETQKILAAKDQELAAKDQEVIVKKFHEQNPEFSQFESSGELQKAMEADPLLDDLAAYYKLKAEKAFELGKAEQARIASGSSSASKVLADQGTSMQTDRKTTKPKGEAGLKQSMLSALAG